jgi:DNA-binding IclR family transcriptional regulator
MSAELVKSAARAFEIMEVFARERRRLSLQQFGQLLDWPRSSLNVLLKSLTAQGYLAFSPADLSYFPTRRLLDLAQWLEPVLLDSALLPMLEAVRDATGETVTLTTVSGDGMRLLRGLPGKYRIALVLDQETSFPLLGTAVGTAYLATLEKPELDFLLARLAARRPELTPGMIEEVRAMVTRARESDYAAAYDRVIADTGAIAVALAPNAAGERYVVAVAGLSYRVRGNEPKIVAELKRQRNLLAGRS